jgi:hypothetical protein
MDVLDGLDEMRLAHHDVRIVRMLDGNQLQFHFRASFCILASSF